MSDARYVRTNRNSLAQFLKSRRTLLHLSKELVTLPGGCRIPSSASGAATAPDRKEPAASAVRRRPLL